MNYKLRSKRNSRRLTKSKQTKRSNKKGGARSNRVNVNGNQQKRRNAPQPNMNIYSHLYKYQKNKTHKNQYNFLKNTIPKIHNFNSIPHTPTHPHPSTPTHPRTSTLPRTPTQTYTPTHTYTPTNPHTPTQPHPRTPTQSSISLYPTDPLARKQMKQEFEQYLRALFHGANKREKKIKTEEGHNVKSDIISRIMTGNPLKSDLDYMREREAKVNNGSYVGDPTFKSYTY